MRDHEKSFEVDDGLPGPDRYQRSKKNGVFVLPGLGRLVKVERKARMGRNPKTGEAMKIVAKKGG